MLMLFLTSPLLFSPFCFENPVGWRGLMVLFSQKVYVGEIADTKDVVDQYEKFFEHKPSLTCVGAQSLPLGAKVMIGCTALA
jgi:hypothetical protein